MKRAILLALLLCTIGFSITRITTFQTVNADFEPKTNFTNGEAIWIKAVILNDEQVSYPKLRVSYFSMDNVNYSGYYYDQNALHCDDILINEGINPGEEKIAYTPCNITNNVSKWAYYMYAYLDLYNGNLYRNSLYFDFNPEQPWVGATIVKIGLLNKTNNLPIVNDQTHKLPVYYTFKANITVHNFNPTQSLTTNLLTRSISSDVNCTLIGQVTLPPNANTSFVTECTTKNISNYNYVEAYLTLNQTPSWDSLLISYFYINIAVDVGTCGNYIIQPLNNEQCDKTNITENRCAVVYPQSFESGLLTCTAPPSCYLNTANCTSKAYYYVDTNNIQTDRTSYIPDENVNVFAKITSYSNRNMPAGSYMTVKFEDRTTSPYKVLLLENASVAGVPPYGSFEKWFSFKNGESPLLNFSVSVYTYFENGTFIPTSKTTTYSPSSIGELNCTNTTDRGIVKLTCTSNEVGRKLLKVAKNGGTLISFRTTPTKALYFWESGDKIYIIDDPLNTVYFVTLGFATQAAPGLNVTLALVLMFFLSFFVWEKYVE